MPRMLCGEMREPPLLAVRASLRVAALDRSPVCGLTHRFYRYPARFSPAFARTAIELFSAPGQLVVDPYMGGGTTVVEALACGRDVVGNDINSLAVFLARVKTTVLHRAEREALTQWSEGIIPTLSYWTMPSDLALFVSDRRAHNLTLPRARAIKKVSALALRSLAVLPSNAARAFARCALLNAGQLFLNGRKRSATVQEFREHVQTTVGAMLNGLSEFEAQAVHGVAPILINASAADLGTHDPFLAGRKADLVVTSPPYPGIHMLYHRWQVDGRKESPAPYWLANCQDGQGNAYYNFADRRATAEDDYFSQSLRTLHGIRSVMKSGASIVQLVAFSDPDRQIRRYLQNMELARFEETRLGYRRMWRNVPSRRWHANLKGKLNGSREVVLIHRMIGSSF